jgi:hypothetical protein
MHHDGNKEIRGDEEEGQNTDQVERTSLFAVNGGNCNVDRMREEDPVSIDSSEPR